MATIRNTYTGNGTTVIYSVTFPYLRQEHVKVTINGTATTAFTFVNSTTIQFTTAPANGASIVIYRETESEDLTNRFFGNSSIRAGALNSNFTQALYVSQETQDAAATATSTANTAITNAASAIATANTASSNASAALSAAGTATTTANNAVLTANSAVNTANAAATTAGNAVTTANNAVSTANAASSTANAASTAASNAVTTANAAQSTANTANSNASAAVSTANTASSNASAALSAAGTATTTANNALSTANSAVTTATGAVSTANNANATAAAAVATANAAQAAVAAVAVGTPVANVAALVAITPAPANGALFEVIDSTGIQSSSAVTGVPGGFTGSSALSVTVSYTTSTGKYAYLSYRTIDPEARYAAKSTETTANSALTNANNALTQLLSAVFTSDPRLSDQRVPTDGSVTNAKVATNAAIALSKLASIPAGAVLMGNGGNVPTATTISGDILLNSSGVASIGTGVIVNSDISSSANITLSKLQNIPSGAVVMGDSGGLPTAFNFSGDVLVDSLGVTSIGTGVIVNSDVAANAAIAGTKIVPDFGSQLVSSTAGFSGQLSGNASTATALQTARTINGVSFNGTSNITLTANTPFTLTPGAYITGSTFNGSADRTWSVNATPNGTPSTIVARDGNNAAILGAMILAGTNDTPLVYVNTGAGLNLKRVHCGVTGSGSYVQQSLNDSQVFVSTDYESERNATGATSHIWRTQGVERARIIDNGLFVGTTTAAPGAGNTTAGFQIRQDGRLCASTDGVNAHSFNRTQTRNSQPIIQCRMNGTSLIELKDHNAGAGVAVAGVSGQDLYVEGNQVRSDTIKGQTTASAANVFINSTTGQLLRSTSSLKYKKDVEDIDPTFSETILEQSRPVWFRSAVDGQDQTLGHWGLIAEEVAEYDPRLVHYGRNEDGTLEPEGVQYERIIPHLLVLLKKQRAQIEDLQDRLDLIEELQA